MSEVSDLRCRDQDLDLDWVMVMVDFVILLLWFQK
jgi:hypothetical protein